MTIPCSLRKTIKGRVVLGPAKSSTVSKFPILCKVSVNLARQGGNIGVRVEGLMTSLPTLD